MRRTTLLLLALMVAFTGVLMVQAQTVIDPPTVLTGQLTNEEPFAFYSFDGQADREIAILLTSSDFDAYLVLENSAGEVVVEDDDSGGRLNALIETTLPADDTYTIIATSLRAYRSNGEFTAAGNFVLSVSYADVPPPTLPASATPAPAELPDPDPSLFPPLIPGEVATFTGRLTDPENPPIYIFEAEAGDTVTIILESNDFDAYLYLLDADGQILAEDDDSGPGLLDSQIDAFVIPATGLYTIQVETFGGSIGRPTQTGAYTLSLVAVVPDEPTPEPTLDEPTPEPTPDTTPEPTPEATPEPVDSADLAYGDIVEARLSNVEPARDYDFVATAGDVVVITLRSEDFDAYLELFNASGERITFDDDSAGFLDSRIGPFTMPADGVFTIRANSYRNVQFGEVETGAFVLTLEQIAPQTININETIEDALGDSSFLSYQFTGEAGDVIIVNFETSNFSTYITLSGDGIDQRTFGGSAQIGPITLTDDGNYTVNVASFDPNDATTYALTINRVETQPIAYDAPVTTTFGEVPLQVYAFEGTAGDIVNITIDSDGSVDTTLTLVAPDGYVLEFDDDGGAGFDPELLNVFLPDDGTYTLVVEPYISGDDGTFTLTVEFDGVRSLDSAAQVVRLSDKNYFETVRFEGVAGETVRLSVRVLVKPPFASPRIFVSQSEDILVENPIGQVQRLILEFIVPEDGPVLVTVDEMYDGGVILELSLERILSGE